MDKSPVGVLGATSLVGACLLPLFARAGYRVTAFSRQELRRADDGIEWRKLTSPPAPDSGPEEDGNIPNWICVAPIWVLPEHFTMLEAYGARRVVTLSSTSRFTKTDSSDSAENAVALRLAEGEARLRTWAESKGVEWVVLRPTLIYGRGRDKNIAEIARFVGRFGFFPLLGKKEKGSRLDIIHLRAA